jgi:hypothetical protein
MQTAAVTSYAALTASPLFSATIAKATAPRTATAIHKSFVCHTLELSKVVLIGLSPARRKRLRIVSPASDYLSLIKINAASV